MIQPSARVERLLLLFPLACAVIAAFGGSLPLVGDSEASPVPHAASAASAAGGGTEPLQAQAALSPGSSPRAY